jgi:K+-sensing histidine kinase KdpD
MQGVPEFIAQLLDKLIANAVEFSEQDSPISVEYRVDNQSTHIKVTNKGPLLPPEIGEHIFDSMVSVRSQSLQKKPHLGLGLYIARLVADFHNAQISANNLDSNDGVEFKLVFKSS